MSTKTTTPKPQTEPSALSANPRAWRTITARRGFSAIEHAFDGDKEMLAVYRVGVSYPPQAIKGTGTRFDGRTLHLMTMSLRHLAEDTRLSKDTCQDVLDRIVASGWATRIRAGKTGQRGTAAYAFFTAEQRLEPRKGYAPKLKKPRGKPFAKGSRNGYTLNVSDSRQRSVTRNVSDSAQSMSPTARSVTQTNVSDSRDEVSQSFDLPERKKKDSSSAGVAESSAGKKPPALPLKRVPSPETKERAKEWDRLVKARDETARLERAKQYKARRQPGDINVYENPEVVAAEKAFTEFNALYDGDGYPKANGGKS